MRFGISPWVWAELLGEKEDFMIDQGRKLGFEGFEVPILGWDLARLPIMEAALQRTGLTPIVSTALPVDCDLIDPDLDVQTNGVRFIRHCVDVAVRLGSELVIGPLCAAPCRLKLSTPEEKKAEFDASVKNLKIAGQYAADRDVRLAFEVMNRFECRIANTVDAALAMLAAVDCPAVGLLLDTFHMNIEEKSPAHAIRRAGAHVFHFHAIENDRGQPGSGSVDWAGVMDALLMIQYPGWVVIEGFSDQADWLARAVCQWRPLASDMTLLARDGLAFLKGMMQSRIETMGVTGYRS